MMNNIHVSVCESENVRLYNSAGCSSPRRASFPFCVPDLPAVPSLETAPDRWQGIYGDVLFPAKSTSLELVTFAEPTSTTAYSGGPLTPILTNFDQCSHFFTGRKFVT